MALTQTATPSATIIKGAFTYHLDNTAIIKAGQPFTANANAI